jgi:hypothetical protein
MSTTDRNNRFRTLAESGMPFQKPIRSNRVKLAHLPTGAAIVAPLSHRGLVDGTGQSVAEVGNSTETCAKIPEILRTIIYTTSPNHRELSKTLEIEQCDNFRHIFLLQYFKFCVVPYPLRPLKDLSYTCLWGSSQ